MNDRTKTQIFIIDDHPLIRKGFRQLFEVESNMSVCGEAENIAQSIALIKKGIMPDVVIIDISLPDGSGLDLIKRIHNLCADIKVLVSSMHDELFFAERALRAGAMGYINKQEAAEHIIEAIKRILKGKIYVSEHMTERLLLKTLAITQITHIYPITFIIKKYHSKTSLLLLSCFPIVNLKFLSRSVAVIALCRLQPT